MRESVLIENILSIRQRAWSPRRIARELGIDRETDHATAGCLAVKQE